MIKKNNTGRLANLTLNVSAWLLPAIFAVGVFTVMGLATLTGDDVGNKVNPEFQTMGRIFQACWKMYLNWTSRIVINPFMYWFNTHNQWWFALFITLCWLGTILTLTRLLPVRQLLALRVTLITASLLLFPFVYLRTAGWIATSVTYFFPLALTLLGICLIERFEWRGQTQLILGCIILLVGLNNEQIAIMGCVCYLSYLVFNFSQLRNLKGKIIAYGIPVVAETLNFLLCPGNRARTATESINYFRNFGQLTIFDKLHLGIISTARHYLFGMNVPALALCFLVAVVAYHQRQRTINKIIAWIPFLLLAGSNAIWWVHGQTGRLTRLVTFPQWEVGGFAKDLGQLWPTLVFQYTVALVWLITLTASLIFVFTEAKERWAVVALLYAGLASRITLGFSPTNTASATRTFTFLTFALLLIFIWLLLKEWGRLNRPLVLFLMVVGIFLNLDQLLLAEMSSPLINAFWVSLP